MLGKASTEPSLWQKHNMHGLGVALLHKWSEEIHLVIPA